MGEPLIAEPTDHVFWDGVHYLRVAGWGDGRSLWREVFTRGNWHMDGDSEKIFFGYFNPELRPGRGEPLFRVFWRKSTTMCAVSSFVASTIVVESAARIRWALRSVGIDWDGVGSLCVRREQLPEDEGDIVPLTGELEVRELLGEAPYSWTSDRLVEHLDPA